MRKKISSENHEAAVMAEEKGTLKTKIVGELFDWVESITFSLVFLIIIFSCVFRVVVVDGSSMIPTLQDDDHIILSSLFYTIEKGDIIVASKPKEQMSTPIIKRVIATEGQTVDIDFDLGIVYVDGVAQDEPYVNTPTNRDEGMKFPLTVEEDCYFVMGDNRNDSMDSRDPAIGQVKRSEIKGKAVLRVFPFTDFGVLS